MTPVLCPREGALSASSLIRLTRPEDFRALRPASSTRSATAATVLYSRLMVDAVPASSVISPARRPGGQGVGVAVVGWCRAGQLGHQPLAGLCNQGALLVNGGCAQLAFRLKGGAQIKRDDDIDVAVIARGLEKLVQRSWLKGIGLI